MGRLAEERVYRNERRKLKEAWEGRERSVMGGRGNPVRALGFWWEIIRYRALKTMCRKCRSGWGVGGCYESWKEMSMIKSGGECVSGGGAQ
jgi:hypothetical protein